MLRLNIGAGWSAIKNYFLPYSEETIICDMIDQHSLILGDRIVSYYSDCVKANGINVDMFKQFIAGKSYSSKSCSIKGCTQDDVGTALKYAFKKIGKDCILLCSDDDGIQISPTHCNYMYSVRDVVHDPDNYLKSHCVPYNVHLVKDEDATKFLDILKHIICKEKTVNLIDPYLLDDYELVENYLFPMLSGGTILNIHIAETELNERKIKQFAKDMDGHNISYNFYLYSEMHDRYITTGSIKVSIGHGLGFVNRRKKARWTTDISIFRKNTCDENDVSVDRRLSGNFVREYSVE